MSRRVRCTSQPAETITTVTQNTIFIHAINYYLPARRSNRVLYRGAYRVTAKSKRIYMCMHTYVLYINIYNIYNIRYIQTYIYYDVCMYIVHTHTRIVFRWSRDLGTYTFGSARGERVCIVTIYSKCVTPRETGPDKCPSRKNLIRGVSYTQAYNNIKYDTS